MTANDMTIEVKSSVRGEFIRQGKAALLRYPTLEECRMAEGREEPQRFEWCPAGGDDVRTSLFVDVVGGDGIQTYVHGRTGPRGAIYARTCVVTYNGDTPAEFHYLDRA